MNSNNSGNISKDGKPFSLRQELNGSIPPKKHTLYWLTAHVGIAENCHLKSQILPNFATKIAKFCHKKLPNLPHFAIKIAKFCKLSLLIASPFFVPEGQEYYIHLKMHTKSHSGAYQKEEWLKTSILYQNKRTKTCKQRQQNLITQDIHKKWNYCESTQLWLLQQLYGLWQSKILCPRGNFGLCPHQRSRVPVVQLRH